VPHQPPAHRTGGGQASSVTSMPSRQSNWQLRTYCWPSTATRHSKQMPMPHRGPRTWLETERRKPEWPASRMAAATVEPRGTRTGTPLIFSCTDSGMGNFHDAVGQIRFRGNGGRAPQKLIEQKAGGGE